MTSNTGQPKAVPWAITFADMSLLLLCFFVMMAALPRKTDEARPTATTSADEAATLLRQRLAEGIDQGWIEFDQDGSRINLQFGTAGGFDVGSDRPTPRTLALIHTLADTLGHADAHVTVAGHTDDMPISTDRFRDNWDLSTARAVSVIRELVMVHGIDPQRLEARGYADTRPLEHNDTQRARARNRRIEIEIAWGR